MTIDPALLDPGERLLWSGQPSALRYARARGGINVLLGLAVLTFAQVWMAAASRDGNSIARIGFVFMALALALLLTPVWRAWRARRTTYALTDRRALTVVGPPFARRTSLPLNQIDSVELRPRSGKTGDVLFREIVRGAETNAVGGEGFIAIGDAAAVERLVLSAMRPAK